MVGKPRVLVCDDEADLRDIFAFDLMQAGFDVLQASGGKEASALIAQVAPDAIVSDVRMPKGSGLDLLNHVRESFSIEMPVLLLTGCGDSEIRRYFGMGANGVFSKPFPVETLVASLSRLLEPRSTRWRAEAANPLPELLLEPQEIQFGRVGFALRSRFSPVPIGEFLSFRIACTKGDVAPFKGSGWVRWIFRADEIMTLGIEVAALAPEDFDATFGLFENSSTKSMIPNVIQA